MSPTSKARNGLISRVVRIDAITPQLLTQMLALMRRFYEDVREDKFREDLAGKRWCVLVEDVTGRIRGFSTQTMLETQVGGRTVRALYSGDTVVDREHWGSSALARAWIRLAVHVIGEYQLEPLYWFLTTKGYRTYRFLPVFFREFCPRWDRETMSSVRALIDAFAGCTNPADYDAARGVVRADGTGYRLRAGVADVTPARLTNRDVRFFQRMNPGHAEGDELCCIAPLTLGNFSPATWRVLGLARAAATVRAGRLGGTAS